MKGDWSRLNEEVEEENSLVPQMSHKIMADPELVTSQVPEAISGKIANEDERDASGSLTPQWGLKVDLDSGCEFLFF